MPISSAAKSISSQSARYTSPKKYIQSAVAAAKKSGFSELKARRMAKAVVRGQELQGSIDTEKRFMRVLKEAGNLNMNKYRGAPTHALRDYQKMASASSGGDTKVKQRMIARAKLVRQEVNAEEQAKERDMSLSGQTKGKAVRSLGQKNLEESIVSMNEYARRKEEEKKSTPPPSSSSDTVTDMFGEAA